VRSRGDKGGEHAEGASAATGAGAGLGGDAAGVVGGFAPGRHEVLAWREVRDWGGRYRVELGSFADVAERSGPARPTHSDGCGVRRRVRSTSGLRRRDDEGVRLANTGMILPSGVRSYASAAEVPKNNGSRVVQNGAKR